MEITTLIIISILVEAIWENCKMIWQQNKINVNAVGSLLLSIIVCCLTQIDIFQILQINIIIPFVGYILTGVIISRGANFVNDLFAKINKRK